MFVETPYGVFFFSCVAAYVLCMSHMHNINRELSRANVGFLHSGRVVFCICCDKGVCYHVFEARHDLSRQGYIVQSSLRCVCHAPHAKYACLASCVKCATVLKTERVWTYF